MGNNTDTRSVEVIIKGTQAASSMKEIASAAAVLNAELKKLPVNSKEFADKAEQLKHVNERLREIREEVGHVKDSFGEMTKEFLLAGGIEGAFEKLKDFAKESILEFAKAEEGVRKLKFSVTEINGEPVKAFEKLYEQSEKLSESLNTLFTPKQIQAVQTQLANFGLTSKMIEELTPRILDVAKATGQTTEEIAHKFILAINGQTKGLRDIGVAFADTGSKTKNFNNVLEQTAKFAGSATDSLQSTQGEMDTFANKWEEFQVRVGGFVKDSASVVKSFLDYFSNGFSSAADADERLNKGLKLTEEQIKKLDEVLEENRKKQIDNLEKAGAERSVIEKAQNSDLEIQKKKYIEEIEKLDDEAFKKEKEALEKQKENKYYIAVAGELSLKDKLEAVNEEYEARKVTIDQDATLKAQAAEEQAAEKAREAKDKALKALQDVGKKYGDAELNDNLQTARQKLENQVFISTRELDEKVTAAKEAGVSEQQIAIIQSQALLDIYQKYADDLSVIEAKEAKDKAAATEKANKDDLEAALDFIDKDAELQEKAGKDKLEHQKKQHELEKRAAQEFGKQMVSLADNLSQIKTNHEDEQIDNYDKKLADTQAKDKDMLDRKLITQKQFNKRELAAQKEHDDKVKAIKKEQFEREQKIAVFKALVAGAEGVAQIWGAYAELPYLAAALSIAETAVVASEIAVIKSAPKPYAAGGFNTSDDPQGFTKGPTLFTRSASGQPFIAGEERKEWIAPNWMVEHPETANIIQSLENIRQNRGFAVGGSTATQTPVFSNSNSTATNNSANNDRLAAAIEMLVANGVEAHLYYDTFVRSLDKINGSKSDARV